MNSTLLFLRCYSYVVIPTLLFLHCYTHNVNSTT
nr:MAG TPA: hypothetical protein [Caudoviricetes sp.]